MLEKRNARKATLQAPKRTAPSMTDDRLLGLATRMLVADGKNPYLKGGLAIRNLEELDQNIGAFEHHEAPWLADWLEYLGDTETAGKIRAGPAHFKRYVHERTLELKNQYK